MGDPPAQYDRGRDWNVDLIPKFLMANGKNYSAHNVNRYFFVFYILSVGSQRMARICHSFIPFFFASLTFLWIFSYYYKPRKCLYA